MALDQIRRDWTKLGADDPLWAVLVAPGKRNGGWNLEEFLATGRTEVDLALRTLDALGGSPRRRERALDFGCGAGRLSQALAAHFDEVVGIDISAPMLEAAERLDHSGGRCRFVLNDATDLAAVPSASVDLVYSSLVLQHMPAELATGYLREFARVVRPGGAVIALVPTATRATVRGVVFQYAPHRLVRWLQRAVLRYPAPMRMHTISPQRVRSALAGAGLSVVGSTSEPEHGPHWHFTRFFAAKAAPRGTAAGTQGLGPAAARDEAPATALAPVER